ncbi:MULTISPECIES: hypothetical protein [Calothrix]|uniref:Uncharacterized protein n=2 Tax=Calothrix TaxID=1186 RepID=A0ABR8AH10_9CYAN|nr:MULTISPECIES: hypothetical protein [Calothrix]MBD2198593.1 hypothetical protein [Calothrix parietina FACHB-288]MBD2226952.1 hypothetical protein [Calothrix anomala FACHB-343]
MLNTNQFLPAYRPMSLGYIPKLLKLGQWSMVNGQWSMVNGQWSMVNGH